MTAAATRNDRSHLTTSPFSFPEVVNAVTIPAPEVSVQNRKEDP
jgi:hypothetical protein